MLKRILRTVIFLENYSYLPTVIAFWYYLVMSLLFSGVVLFGIPLPLLGLIFYSSIIWPALLVGFDVFFRLGIVSPCKGAWLCFPEPTALGYISLPILSLLAIFSLNFIVVKLIKKIKK